MDAGLDGDDEVAVGGGHDDREDARQRQPRQADGQHLDGERGDDRVRRAVLRDLIRADELVRDDAHEPDERNRQAIDERTEEESLLRGPAALGGEGALPHLRAREGKDEVGDDVAEDAAVDIGLRQLRGEVLQKDGEAAELHDRRRGDHDVDEQDQHHELEHVRIDDADEIGGRGVVHDHDAGDERAELEGDADLAAEHVDDGGGGRDLRGDGAHHREGDQAAEDNLRRFAEALLEEGGDG